MFNRMLRGPYLWTLLLFVILPCLAFPEIIFGRQTLYWTDLTWIHYPRHIFAAEEWLAGRVPLWDPYEDTGIPLLAEAQIGVLYPFSAIFLSPLSPSLELSLFILLHFTLAALFTFLLARAVGMGSAAATIAGLAYGCGGFLMAQVPNLNIMTGAVWLPLILYSVRQTLRQRRWLIAGLSGLPLALQILTAQPQIVFYTLVIVIGYALYHTQYLQLSRSQHPFDCAQDKPQMRQHSVSDAKRASLHKISSTEPIWQSVLLFITMIGSGLLLAAPQWLPTYELQQLSVRSQERGLEFLTENSLHPLMLLNLLLPGVFGNNVTGFRGGDPFQEVFIYVGIMPLLLVGFSWLRRNRREVWFFYGLLLISLLLALGRFTPLYAYLIQYLPGFGLFRIPARWLMGVNLALAMLAGFGLEAIREKGVSRRALWGVTGIGVGLLVALAAMWLFRAELPAAAFNEFQQRLLDAAANKAFTLHPTYIDERLLDGLGGLRIPAVLLGVNIFLSLTLLGLFALKRISYNGFAGLLIVAVSIDLAAAGGTTINPLKPESWWQELSGGAAYVLDNVGQARVFPLGMGSEEATVSHLGQYFPSVYRVRSAGGHGSSLLNARYKIFLDESDPVQAIQVTGVRYLLTLGQMGADVAATYPLVYSDENSYVYENPRPLPRAFVVHQAIAVDEHEEALALLAQRAFDPTQTVVLEVEAATELPPAVDSVVAASDSQATIVNEHPQLVEISVNLTQPGYLVLLDTYYPGWQATVDGQPTVIYPANSVGRAIFLPAGGHTVRFEYRPWSFRWGVALASLAIVALAAAITIRVTQIPSRKLNRRH